MANTLKEEKAKADEEAQYIVKNISKSLSEGEVVSEDVEENSTVESNIPDSLPSAEFAKDPCKDGILKFFPPVYVQRYETVALILKDPVWKDKIRKVVDFGCSELGFFMYLKNAENITEILEVDIDAELLERCSHKAAPLTCDYLMTKANKPLDVYILAGSIADYDDHLIGCDAVVAIELIEHLNEDAFNKLPYNIFHRIRPKLAIFTTPNADFNSLFPNFKDVRHEDHKFEWTRKEFFNWTQEVIKLYPEYSARFYGIGAGPEGTENLGCCSQMAVFQRSDDSESFSSARDTTEGIHNYKLIKHYKYPIYIDTRTTEEKIIHEIQYQVAYFNTISSYYNYENCETEIPLSLLKEYVAELCPDEEEFRNILKKNGMMVMQRNSSWFLIHKDADSSDELIKDDRWSEEEFIENFKKLSSEDTNMVETTLWDDELFLENFSSVKSARSLEELDRKMGERNKKDIFTNLKRESALVKKDEVRSDPHINNQIMQGKRVSAKRNRSNKIKSNTNEDSNNSDDVEGLKSSPIRSKIPRKRNDNKDEKHSLDRNFGRSSLSYKSQSSHPGF